MAGMSTESLPSSKEQQKVERKTETDNRHTSQFFRRRTRSVLQKRPFLTGFENPLSCTNIVWEDLSRMWVNWERQFLPKQSKSDCPLVCSAVTSRGREPGDCRPAGDSGLAGQHSSSPATSSPRCRFASTCHPSCTELADSHEPPRRV